MLSHHTCDPARELCILRFMISGVSLRAILDTANGNSTFRKKNAHLMIHSREPSRRWGILKPSKIKQLGTKKIAFVFSPGKFATLVLFLFRPFRRSTSRFFVSVGPLGYPNISGVIYPVEA